MGMIACPKCRMRLPDNAVSCPRCGSLLKPPLSKDAGVWRGFEWKSRVEIKGWPLVHIAFGRDKHTGKLLIAKGIVAIGQFAFGVITIAQFGVGLLFAFGQFTGGIIAIGQFALGIYFGLGQFASGLTAIGQFALGKYVLAQMGLGEYVWSVQIKDPRALEYFRSLWCAVRGLL